MRLPICAALAALLFAGVAAHADTISVYSLKNQAATSSYGTVTIDSTIGSVLSSSLSVVVNGITEQFAGAPIAQGNNIYLDAYQATLSDGGNELLLQFAGVQSLVDYTPLDRPGCKNNAVRCDVLANVYLGPISTSNRPALTFEGNLAVASPATGVTPEPASVALLGTGLLGLAGLVRRRSA